MPTVAVLPVKSWDRAKQRLAGALDGAARAKLAEAMVGDVLDALASVEGLEEVLVVTGDPRTAAAARAAGARIVAEPSEAGHSRAALLGIEDASRRGATRTLLVAGDCPVMDPREVGDLLGGGRDAEVVIVPDRHGTGTNALVLSPPGAMAPSFGPGSCARHVALARAAGVSARVEPVLSLALDVDDADDLAALAAALEARAGAAPRTRRLLETLVPVAGPRAR